MGRRVEQLWYIMVVHMGLRPWSYLTSTTFVNPGYPCMCIRITRQRETRVIKQPSQRSVASILSCQWIKWPSSTLACCISFFSLILNLYILLVFSAAAFKHLLSNNGVPNKVCGCAISIANLIITFFFFQLLPDGVLCFHKFGLASTLVINAR